MSEDQTQNLTSGDKLDLILERLTALEAKSSDTRPLHEQTCHGQSSSGTDDMCLPRLFVESFSNIL